ncbi:MAG TPA: alpha/beta fold hydrolase, partial [Isosphaeraceae bacterium]|nr:alpha/beta fold hydrolase [Isosphaeraceae bacterium]
MPRVKVSNLIFHVQQSGTGPDVVLIHGLTGDLSIWFLSRTIQSLAETSRVTAYDLRGHGYSDAPATGYTSLDHARDLIAVLDVVGIARARLLGHSFGAVIAVHAAVVTPERFEALVLSDPYFPALRYLEDV